MHSVLVFSAAAEMLVSSHSVQAVLSKLQNRMDQELFQNFTSPEHVYIIIYNLQEQLEYDYEQDILQCLLGTDRKHFAMDVKRYHTGRRG